METHIWVSFILALLAISCNVRAEDLPTVYQYYTEGGIKSGMEALKEGFKLNGKDLTIQSGAIHYFRVHPKLWRDRLRKLRATGLIAVETYVPWNLHEPERGVYDFGQGGRDFSDFLNLPEFLRIAKEEDLLVLLRPGPYICAEWEMGGLPSWLLNIPGIKLRTSEKQYSEIVAGFFNHLLPLVKDLQFTNNGSIIAVQLENEYASIGYGEGPDQQHLRDLKQLMDQNGIKELLYTSDNSPVDASSIPEALRTINFQSNVEGNLNRLKEFQPDKPSMVMEFWTGWFDHWMTNVDRLGFTPSAYKSTLETIMKYPASFNLYMFHGGTSFGFLNGANSDNGIVFDVTSYDYYAPLSESGDYTEKYDITEQLVAAYQPVKLNKPARPASAEKVAYPAVNMQRLLDLSGIYNSVGTKINSKSPVNMESLDINNGNGQSYGYIWYRREGLSLKQGDTLKISGHVRDIAQVFVDGKLQSKLLQSRDDINGFGFWKISDGELVLKDGGSTLDILVENLGRINFGTDTYISKKGIYEGPVYVNGQELTEWKIAPLEFNKKYIESLGKFSPDEAKADGEVAAGLYKGTFTIDDEPKDTFLDTTGWTKGVVFINGFNLGRHNKLGPQQRLYLPAPLLNRGQNTLVLFEQFVPGTTVTFASEPNLGS